MAAADIRDPAIVREDSPTFLAYLNGLPDEIRRAGAFTSYEQRAGELTRELVLTDMLLRLKLPGSDLTAAPEYGHIYDSLSVMTRAYRETAERGRNVGRGVQWAFVAASAASLASALMSATALVAPFSGVAVVLGGFYVSLVCGSHKKARESRDASVDSARGDYTVVRSCRSSVKAIGVLFDKREND